MLPTDQKSGILSRRTRLKKVSHVLYQVGNLTQSGMILRQLGLCNEWVMKLVQTYCHLRDKEADDEDSLKLLKDPIEGEMLTND